MSQKPSPLDRAVELVLTTGLAVSSALLLAGLITGKTATLRAGVLLLLLTPVARVIVVTVGLIKRRDWLFALTSLWIFGVLLSSLWIAGQAERNRTLPKPHPTQGVEPSVNEKP